MPTPVLLFAAAMIADGSPEGRWTNPTGSVTVAIAECGAALCGTVVAASDRAKKDAAKGGTATLVGTPLMTGFTSKGDGKWRGRLFVPDINYRSHADLTLIDSNTLKVRGCMAGRMLCKSQLWKRAD
jgi:uncharacterized protein (DUF2147 family)